MTPLPTTSTREAIISILPSIGKKIKLVIEVLNNIVNYETKTSTIVCRLLLLSSRGFDDILFFLRSFAIIESEKIEANPAQQAGE